LVVQLAADLLKAPFAAVGLRSPSGAWSNIVTGCDAEWRTREIPLFAAALEADACVSAEPPPDFPLAHARFFAACALPTRSRAGVLAIADTAPRELSTEQMSVFRTLARMAAEAAGLRESGPDPTPSADQFDIAFSIDLSGRIISANQGLQEITGYSDRELASMHITEMIVAAERDRFWARMAAQLGSGGADSFEAVVCGKKGLRATLQLRTRLRFERGLPVGIDAFGQKLTAASNTLDIRGRMEQELRDKRSELAEFSDHLRQLHRLSTTDYNSIDDLFSDYLDTGCAIFRMPAGLVLQNTSGSIEIRASHLRGSARLGAIPPECASLEHTADSSSGAGALPCWIATPIFRGAEPYGTLMFCSSNPGDARVFTAHERELIELMAKGIGRSVYERQLHADRERLTERLSEQVRLDPLTAVSNRSHFSECLESALAAAERDGTGLALLFIDLDRFKQINDTLGHTTGDAVLQQVAGRLRTAAPSRDCVGRMGGDEFALILPGCTSRDEITPEVQRLLEELRRPYFVDGFELLLTVSIGISAFPLDGRDPKALLQKADAAMYRAKAQGKNDYYFFGPDLALRTMKRLELENELRRALERGELQMCYQPMMRMDGSLDSLETLLAWNNSKFGKVGASRFIPIAEESGIIVGIGHWVLKQACIQNAKWQIAGRPPVRVSVNVSSLQFARADFYETIADALYASGLPPQCLDLELTESIIMRDVEESVRRMWQVRRLGVSMSIDDFGTGYSSLSYLRRLPVDALKIDRSFIAELASSGSSRPLIQTIIVLAHNMGLSVVAEGVETREQLNILRALGCDKVQGHLFGEPMSAAAVEEQLLSSQ
jgi:diguanylate cyclase (GGDEF)-like protein/PAS domain S-box-containing protein